MHYKKDGEGVRLFSPDSFSLTDTLECGQCFRHEKTENGYKINAKGHVLYIEENAGDFLFHPCMEEEFEEIWIDYFDLKTNYSAIKETLAANDPVLRDAVEYAPGIRILNQDRWECLLSFIISQNNNIPRIKKIIRLLSQAYGEQLSDEEYTFPAPAALCQADETALMACNTGFRAKYILDAAKKVHDKQLDLASMGGLSTHEVKERLMGVKGIGDKVSDCVLLFSFGRREIFPVDVWVRRIMSHFYFNGKETSIGEIHQKAQKLFGEYGGYAQQYLFHYARQFEFEKK